MERKKNSRKIKVLLTKSKMDVHDRGLRYLARKMLEAGLEVILIRHGLVDEVVNVALQEDVDVIGLSFSAGGHLAQCKRLQNLLRANGIDDKMVITGGIIPDDDIPALKKFGVAGAFGAGSNADEAIEFIKTLLPA